MCSCDSFLLPGGYSPAIIALTALALILVTSCFAVVFLLHKMLGMVSLHPVVTAAPDAKLLRDCLVAVKRLGSFGHLTFGQV